MIPTVAVFAVGVAAIASAVSWLPDWGAAAVAISYMGVTFAVGWIDGWTAGGNEYERGFRDGIRASGTAASSYRTSGMGRWS